MIYRCWIKN